MEEISKDSLGQDSLGHLSEKVLNPLSSSTGKASMNKSQVSSVGKDSLASPDHNVTGIEMKLTQDEKVYF